LGEGGTVFTAGNAAAAVLPLPSAAAAPAPLSGASCCCCFFDDDGVCFSPPDAAAASGLCTLSGWELPLPPPPPPLLPLVFLAGAAEEDVDDVDAVDSSGRDSGVALFTPLSLLLDLAGILGVGAFIMPDIDKEHVFVCEPDRERDREIKREHRIMIRGKKISLYFMKVLLFFFVGTDPELCQHKRTQTPHFRTCQHKQITSGLASIHTMKQ